MYREFRAFVNKGNLVPSLRSAPNGPGTRRVRHGRSVRAVTTTFTDRIVSPLVGLIVRVPSLADVLTFGEPDPQTGIQPGSVGASSKRSSTS